MLENVTMKSILLENRHTVTNLRKSRKEREQEGLGRETGVERGEKRERKNKTGMESLH